MEAVSKLGGKVQHSALRSDNALISFVWVEPDCEMQPPHSHDFDQFTMILSGTLVLVVDDVEYIMPPGSAVLIPAGAMHTGRVQGSERVFNIDVFSPPRADYLPLAEHQNYRASV